MYMCADSLCCTAEMNTTVESNNTPIKINFKKQKTFSLTQKPSHLTRPAPPAFFPTLLVTCNATDVCDLSPSCFCVYYSLCLESPSCLVHSQGASHLCMESQLTKAAFPFPRQADHTLTTIPLHFLCPLVKQDKHAMKPKVIFQNPAPDSLFLNTSTSPLSFISTSDNTQHPLTSYIILLYLMFSVYGLSPS